jgi:hypothetical protein
MEMIFSFLVFVLFFIGMSIGYVVKGRPLKGSCGGVAALMGSDNCEICGGDPARCRETQQARTGREELVYDAMPKSNE